MVPKNAMKNHFLSLYDMKILREKYIRKCEEKKKIFSHLFSLKNNGENNKENVGKIIELFSLIVHHLPF